MMAAIFLKQQCPMAPRVACQACQSALMVAFPRFAVTRQISAQIHGHVLPALVFHQPKLTSFLLMASSVFLMKRLAALNYLITTERIIIMTDVADWWQTDII